MNFPRRDDATNKELILTIIEIQGYLSRYGKSHTNWHETLNEVIERLERAERPQRMRGKWIDGHRMSSDGTFHWYRMCSECDYERDDDNIDMDTNFCPNCGAWMGGQDENNRC